MGFVRVCSSHEQTLTESCGNARKKKKLAPPVLQIINEN